MTRGLSCFLIACICLGSACARPQRPVFPPVDASLVWPPPPDAPRVRFVGELSGEANLDIRPTALETLGALFTGPKPLRAFITPTSVVARGSRVYVADGQSHCVWWMDTESRTFGEIREAAGAPLAWPIDLVLSSDRLWVVDSQRAAVFVYTPDGTHRATVGQGPLKRPGSAAHDPQRDELYVVDCAAHDCKVFDAEGRLARTIGRRGASLGEFNFPVAASFHPALGLVVADAMNFRVQILSAEGVPHLGFGKKGDAAGDFAMPRDVTVDEEGKLWVLDNQFENIQIFDREGRLLMALGEEGRNPGQFYLPSGISLDDRGRIWVADTYNRRVQVFQFLKEDQP